MSGGLTFDLVVATLGRSSELDGLLASLERQMHQGVRVRLLVVDQNEDERVEEVRARHPTLESVVLRSAPGLSRARNVALPSLRADVVAFPDDDCVYPDVLLAAVAARLAERPELDGVSGQSADPHGAPSGRWPSVRCPVGLDTVWNRANSHTIFLRRELVARVGRFDETLGLGSGTPWHSGEEIDFLVRALRLGARIEYDPELVVLHPARRLDADGLVALGRRDGSSVGFILARHGYGARVVARMLMRPAGGALLALLRRDRTRARFQLATLRGRLAGYRAGRRIGVVDVPVSAANSSA
jgi:glycosyltransferase involved in cell wall biosynthesis